MSDAPARGARHASIDLARCVAVFGVIVIHGTPLTEPAGRVADFFLNFSVPFFLLTALFFFWRDVDREPVGQASAALRRRLPRLLLPYIAWTAIYVAAIGAKLAWQSHSIRGEFHAESVVRIIGAGGGAVHLYFLPLLMLAFSLAWLAAPWVRRCSRRGLAILLIPAVFLLVQGENLAPPMPTTIAGRLAALYLDWMIWMAPIVSWAAVVARWMAGQKGRPTLGLVLLILAVGLDLLIVARITPYVWRLHSLVLATLLLGACLHGAAWVERLPSWATPVLKTSFGVYLSHHLVLEMLELADRSAGNDFTQPYSGGTILVAAAMAFAISVGFTLVIARRPRMSLWLLGR